MLLVSRQRQSFQSADVQSGDAQLKDGPQASFRLSDYEPNGSRSMPQEMSFAQALTEARQIIVQQSNRIKGDLDRIKTMQETIAAQTGTISENDRSLRQKSAELEAMNQQVKTVTARCDELKTAKEQAEAVIDRQGQRLTQMQDALAGTEKQITDLNQRINQLASELQQARSVAPTSEDTEALAALAALLAAKKGAQPKPAEEAAAA